MKSIPLPRTFMLFSILGFLIVTIFTFNPFSERPLITIPLSWGFAFDLVFIMMFIASVLSITPSGKILKS